MVKQRMDLLELLRKRGMDGDVDFLREALRVLVDGIMDAEVSAQIGAEHGERNSERRTYRNGYRNRTWDTRVGTMELHIPKLREGSYFPSLLEPRRRSEKALLAVIQQAYVEGVSTCRRCWPDRGHCPSPGAGQPVGADPGARPNRQGVEVIQVNPAYSSVIGRVKFMERYGLTVHQATALVLARRLLGCSERIPRRWVAPMGNGVQVAFIVPVRKRVKHVWTYWGVVSGQLRPALAAQHRLGRRRRRPNPVRAVRRAEARGVT